MGDAAHGEHNPQASTSASVAINHHSANTETRESSVDQTHTATASESDEGGNYANEPEDGPLLGSARSNVSPTPFKYNVSCASSHHSLDVCPVVDDTESESRRNTHLALHSRSLSPLCMLLLLAKLSTTGSSLEPVLRS
ncbi:hypothetical protein AB6A40_011030 [Gnathostoma spinigerum]|uniref:Uncharacterized protein n=1 Tax=Gnathostoma spinigerum TaxID=75299 RepID=A0ABD6EWP7_9BILA